ncbi:MAG: putative zinc-binding metallopeptidase [Comamonas sp.]
MRLFHCDQCGHLVFFDSVQCVHCGATLAYLPDCDQVAALRPTAPPADSPQTQRYIRHTSLASPTPQQPYRMCGNRLQYQACNFAIRADEPYTLCSACRQTLVLPDLSVDGNMLRWQKLESAKQRLYYTLARLGLHPEDPNWSPHYQFLADMADQPPVITGHASGLITINIAEADDDERVRRRVALHEPYRTLVGHLRHESGHYFWDRLVRDGGELDSFRLTFGDERKDYNQALQHYYANPPGYAQWSTNFVSAYASAHPWEDWAESWAHYLHMVDLLETAATYGTQVTLPERGAPPATPIRDPFSSPTPQFEDMVAQWVPLTLLLNSLNRSLGQLDAYPFAVSGGALRKLRYVHELVHRPRTPYSNPVTVFTATSAIPPQP